MCDGVHGAETLGQPMPFESLAPLLLIATGVFMVLTGSVIRDEDGDIMHISGQLFIGPILIAIGVLFPVILVITSL